MTQNIATGHLNIDQHLDKRIQLGLRKAKAVDIIVSFIMESGVRLIEKELAMVGRRNVPIRILTGNYLNITQPSALYKIRDILGDKVDLRLYNDKSRSFHPKAYLFIYDDYSEIYVGSSNLSKSALTSGVEWNYRIDSRTSPNDFQFFKTTFEDLFLAHSTIIDDQVLSDYSKTWVKPKILFEGKEATDDLIFETPKVQSLFEPRGAQIEALYHLKKTREVGNTKGLVVAATGIGKTYLAAFDSREFNRVLFVAHREEILKQAKQSFFNIRPDKSSGFFMGNIQDMDTDFLFASVQSLGKEVALQRFSKTYFDYIVIDEFHHATANQYQAIIDYFEPAFLLGLTATPDRLDNRDVFAICDYNTVYEVDLRGAINKGWLVPFRYYGIWDESVKYDQIEFKNGKFDAQQLEEALNVGKRAELVLSHYRKYKSHAALGFCTSKKHAEFMAEYFDKAGVPSGAVYSGEQGSYALPRELALGQLKRGEIKVLFSIDMFNEGMDVKSIDLVMFLRPTESPTIFLQQLGRGLRLDKHKKYLNVLDFIGNHKKANLAPYLLTGRKPGKGGGKGGIRGEEQFPEDCFVDFDFRLVDLFERMERESKKISDWIHEEFNRIQEDLGHVPSRLEMFTYLDDTIYLNMKSRPKDNIFRDYGHYLYSQGIVRTIDDTLAGDFIKMIENTAMSKSYKMPILLAFYNHGKPKSRVNTHDLFEAFKEFYAKGSNKVDLLKDRLTAGFETWNESDYVKKPVRKQPLDALLKTHSDFFYMDGDEFCLNEELIPYLDNPEFVREFKDVVEFRTKQFYKERYEGKV